MQKLSKEEKAELKAFEKKLGYRFRHKDLLKTALTHKSYANEQRLSPLEHNERFEFLGDAVLELVISDLLMEQYPDSPEGDLSKIRAALVNEKTLANVARAHELGDYLYLGKGEDKGEGRTKPSLLSDALEAVLGAIYLDRGIKRAYKVIEKIASELFAQLGSEGFYKDYKTLLQEKIQTRFKTIPKYRLIKETGPDHEKTFEIHLFVRGERIGQGKGKSKKGAEQKAAQSALKYLKEEVEQG